MQKDLPADGFTGHNHFCPPQANFFLQKGLPNSVAMHIGVSARLKPTFFAERFALLNFGLLSVFPGGDDFEPVAVGVGYEVDTHFGVFVTDTAHLFVTLAGGVKVVHFKGKVELVVA